MNLLIGDNNIGKSYSITLIYLILKNILAHQDLRSFFPYAMGDGPTSLSDDIKNKISSEGFVSLNITDFVLSSVSKVLHEVILSDIESSFIGAFSSLSSLQNGYGNGLPSFEITTENFILVFVIDGKKLRVSSFNSKHEFYLLEKVDSDSLEYSSASENFKKKILVPSNDDEHDHEHEGIVFVNDIDELFRQRFIFSEINEFIQEATSGIGAIHYLPASRSGLYQALSAFGQIVAELSKKRAFVTQKIELPGISEPVSDYFIKLSEVVVATKKDIVNKEIHAIAKKIETELLDGEVIFDNKTKQLIFKPQGTNLNLELSSTSSMVSEIAPIVTYLRHILSKKITTHRNFFFSFDKRRAKEPKILKQLVIIEEPEAHLHPEVQIKLTEIFENIIENDVNIIVTSHSNFIFNKINNLIIGNTCNKKTTGFNEGTVDTLVFKKTDEGSIIDRPEIDSFGIEDVNFSDAIQDLLKEKMQLISQYNEEMDH